MWAWGRPLGASPYSRKKEPDSQGVEAIPSAGPVSSLFRREFDTTHVSRQIGKSMSRRPVSPGGCMLVSCADAFAFGYLDKILCLPPHAQPSVGTAFPVSWLLLLPAWGCLGSSSSQQTSWRVTPPVSRLPGWNPSHSHLHLVTPYVCACEHARVCVQLTAALFPVPGAKERTLHPHLWALGPGHFSLDEATPFRPPWTEEPGGLSSRGPHGVGHD